MWTCTSVIKQADQQLMDHWPKIRTRNGPWWILRKQDRFKTQLEPITLCKNEWDVGWFSYVRDHINGLIGPNPQFKCGSSGTCTHQIFLACSSTCWYPADPLLGCGASWIIIHKKKKKNKRILMWPIWNFQTVKCMSMVFMKWTDAF